MTTKKKEVLKGHTITVLTITLVELLRLEKFFEH